MSDLPGEPRRRAALSLLGLIVLLGLALRIPGLGYSISPDEAYSLECIVRRGLRAVFLGPYVSGNHLFSSFTGWIAFSIFGDEDWVIQLPPLFFGLATIPLIYAVGAALLRDRRVGIAAALLLACAPYHIAYSTNFRGYVAEMFFALAALYFLYRSLQAPRLPRLIGLCLTAALMALSQVSSLLVGAAFSIAVGVILVWALVRKRWTGPASVSAALLSGVSGGVALALVDIAYSPVFSLHRGVLKRVFDGQWSKDMLGFLAGAEHQEWHAFDRYTETITGLTGPWFWVATAFAAAGLAVCLLRGRWGSAVCGVAAGAPIAVVYALGIKTEPRYLMVLMPVFLLALAAGIVVLGMTVRFLCERVLRLPSRLAYASAWTCFLGATAVFCMATAPLYLREFPRGAPKLACVSMDTKPAARFLAEAARDNDIIMYHRKQTWPIELYLNRYVMPKLQPVIPLPAQVRLWYLCGPGNEEHVKRLRVRYPVELAASFHNYFVYAADISTQALRSVALPPLQLNLHGAGNNWLSPWTMTGMADSMSLFVGVDADKPDTPVLQVSGAVPEVSWEFLTPATPCGPDAPVVFRVEADAEFEMHTTVALLQFFDASGSFIEEHTAPVPCGNVPPRPTTWRQFHVATLTPENAASLAAGIRIAPLTRPGRRAAFRNFALWTEVPQPSRVP